MRGGGTSADTDTPANNSFAAPSSNLYVNPAQSVAALSSSAIGTSGGNQPHNNQQPYLAMSFIIALQGIFPLRP